MFSFLKKLLPDTHPIRLMFHKLKAIIASIVYGFPGNKMIVIGVTGTKGKSTTTNLIAAILSDAGYKVGMTSTINFQIADKKWVNDTKQTTLSPFKINALLSQMVKAGCKYAVIEVSSHSVTQSRVWGINFDCAVVTNVTPEHIEYHGSFDSYLCAKGELFKKVMKAKRKPNVPKVLVLNADDKEYGFFNQFIADKKISYGLKNATIFADQIEKNARGSSFFINVPNNRFKVNLNIPGDFNIYNALAAASMAIALDIDVGVIADSFSKVSGIPGRFEHVYGGQNFNVIVDYAHTPESLEGLLSLYKPLSSGRVILVFGCTGGGRDKAKRPVMGEIAHRYADLVVLTDDDPYEEDEMTIIEDIAKGIPRVEGENFWKIPDRREAIRLALIEAEASDTVIVAGKGAEEVIVLKDGPHKWNDKQVIIELIKRDLEVNLK
jgi:UDP-N-acetylmuramoyl-L-alanyl-D-glutamate--2,6-diaminopimelate ligase